MSRRGTCIAGVVAAMLVMPVHASALPDGISVERKQANVQPNSQGQPSTTCGSNAYTLSGSYTAPQNSRVVLSRGYPLSSSIGGSWSFGLDNLKPQRAKVSLRGVCARRSAVGTVSFQRQSNPFATPLARTQQVAQCPAGTKVLGGGSSNSSGFTPGAATASSFPIDGTDANTRPDDAWAAEIDNFDSASATFVASDAICANPSRVDFRVRLVESPLKTIRPNRTKIVTAKCRKKYAPISGGFNTTSTYDEMFALSNGLKGKRGWSTRISNRSGSNDFLASAFALCAR